jgi:MFS family permease
MAEAAPKEVNARSVGASIAATLGNFAGPSPMITATLGIFAIALTKEFGWSRTAFYTVNVLVAWLAALSSPFVGRAVDRFGARPILLPGALLFGVVYASISFANGSLTQFFLLFGMVGLLAGVQSHVGYKKVVSQWFSRHRGMALTLVSAIGVGVGTAIMPQVARFLVANAGWREAYQMIGLLIIVVGVPIPFFLLREPQKKAAGASGPPVDGPVRLGSGASLREATGTLTFWLMVLSIVLSNTALVGTSAHTFPFLTDRGVDPKMAATVLSVVAIGSIVGQLSSGYLLDRKDTPRIAIPFFGAALVGGLMLHFSTAPPLVLIGGFLMGATKGAELGLIGYFCTRYYGVRSFGVIYGLIYGLSTFSAGLGPLLMALSYDRLGSYTPMFIAFDISFLLSLIAVAALKPYTYSKAGDPLAAAAGPSVVAPAQA